jgi:YggT family protein
MILLLRLLTGIGSAYLILIFIRVLLTWFHGVEYGKPYQIICSLTDPYLNLFRRFKFLRLSMLDLSPIAGIMVLVILMDLLTRIIHAGKISLGIVLAVMVAALWSALSFLISLFIILTVIRFIMGLSGVNSVGTFARTVDLLIAPVLEKTRKTFFKKRFVTYNTILASTGATLLAIYLLGNVMFNALIRLLSALPV